MRTVKHAKLTISSFDESVSHVRSSVQEMLAHLKISVQKVDFKIEEVQFVPNHLSFELQYEQIQALINTK